MRIEILGQGTFESALITLNPGESFRSESGAMFRASENIDIDVTTESGGKGGFFAGIKRMLAGENFFFSTYKVKNDRSGEVGIAPTHAGQLRVVTLTDDVAWLCTGGSYLGSTMGLVVDTRFQGLKGFFSGESISFVHVSGRGHMLVGAFGRVIDLDVEDELTVDTGHVVAFEETLDYTIGKAGKSWLQTWLAGEGLVIHFKGQGKVLVQSHNLKEFGKELGPMLPPR